MADAAEPAVGEAPGLSSAAYDALVDAAETYRAALVVRLAGEAGLRTGEITRVRPSDLREVGSEGHGLLTVYDADGDAARTAYVPPSLAAELRRYADSMGLADDERFVDVSERRVQMIVGDTADRAAARSDAVHADRISPRTLRQFFARHLLVDREVDPRVVRAIGGWETLGALDPYLDHPDDPAIVDAFDAGNQPPTTAASSALDAVVEALDVVATAGSRAALLTRIPARLAAAGDWEAAWIATRERTADELEVAAAAGTDPAELSERGLRTTDPDAPWMRAVDEVDAAAAGDGGEGSTPDGDAGGSTPDGDAGGSTPDGDAGGSTTGDGDGGAVPNGEGDGVVVGDDERVVAVPLSYRGTSYGVLCLLGDGLGVGSDAAGDGGGTRGGKGGGTRGGKGGGARGGNGGARGGNGGARGGGGSLEGTDGYRRALGRLGGVVGRSLASFRWHDLLQSDTVLELAFETSARAAFPVRLTAELDCRVDLDSTVTTDDALLIYVDVDGATPHDVADVVDAIDGVEDTRVVETRDDGCTLGIVVTGASPAHVLTEHGATVRSASASDGELRVVADVPTGTDVRPIAEGLRRSFPDAHLVGKREIDREPGTGTPFRDEAAERLTDRQRATLKAAYHGGYFDWPREITAEEVADAMDVSSPTLHNHLRKGQRALLDSLFDDDRL